MDQDKTPREDGRPESVAQATPRAMRALAHPVRLKILGRLRTHGPATATSLAALFELNSGATSYHLRQLADAGLIVEDPDLGTARDRWWRSAHQSTQYSRQALPEGDESGDAFLRAVGQIYAERVQRTLDDRVTLPEAWQDAINLSDHILRLTAQEARELSRDLHDLLLRYRRNDPEHTDDAPADAIPVSVQFQVLPFASEVDDSDRRSDA